MYRTRPRVGEVANGDAALVRVAQGRTLFAVIDALGHGPVASSVAQRAVESLEAASLSEGLLAAFEGLHSALKGTRGAGATLGLHVDGEDSLELCGVGNVYVRGLQRSVSFAPSAGVLGGRASRARVARVELRAGESLLVHSDGVARRSVAGTLEPSSPLALCERLLSLSHPHDDATALVLTAFA